MEKSDPGLWKTQTFPNAEVRVAAQEKRLVSTYRPIEIMFAATGKEPYDLSGKKILNVGAGKTHWGFELTKKYGVIASRFDNFDIAYAGQNVARRIAGKLLQAESVGNVHKKLPFKDASYDVVWCSYAPTNWDEFLRVVKPGGEIFELGGDSSDETAKNLSERLNVPVSCQTISKERMELWKGKVPGLDQGAIEQLTGKKMLIVKKPSGGPDSRA